ncbi:MAG: glycosyltransferase [Agriterribacter sp.]
MQNKIPNILHFIYGLEKDFGNKPFSLAHYLAIKSACVVNRPEKIFFYYKYLPSGTWWDQTLEMIEPIQISVPIQIFGNKLCHFAHKADVLRLLILFKFGGIYMDIDTISIKSLQPLRIHQCVMAEETLSGEVVGLCNAVILASKGNAFLKCWLSSYQTFRSKGRDAYWCEHSVLMPLHLSKLYPDLIEVLPENAFHYPSYTQENLQMLFEECSSFPDAYLHHLWETFSYDKYLATLSIDYIKSVDTTYNLIARRFL